MLYPMKRLLSKAFEESYAIPQPNFVNITMAANYLRAAGDLNSPLILGFGEDYIKASGANNLRHLVKIIDTLSEGYEIPIVLHLDHGSSYEICVEAINAGFTSVMIDGSMLPLKENINLTKKVVSLANKSGVSVEAELGSLETGDGYDLVESNYNKQVLTSPETAKVFIEETNVDALAVSIGSVHGSYVDTPNIDIKLLSEIKRITNTPLVLHGASGIPHDVLTECSRNGISKVNIFTDFTKAVNQVGQEVFNHKSLIQLPYLINKINSKIENKLKEYITTLGSKNMM